MDFLITSYKEFYLKLNLESAHFTETLSKVLGYAIIISYSLVKIPQIIKIYQNESGEGISITSIILSVIAHTIYMAYNYLMNFPFFQWGETLFSIFQSLIIGILVLHYEDCNEKAAAFGVMYFVFLLIVINGFIPLDVLWNIQGVNIFIVLTSKSIQIYKNYVNSDTGQLSAISTNLHFLGALARIFTSVQETGDLIIILGSSVIAIANGILAAQIWYYSEEEENKSD